MKIPPLRGIDGQIVNSNQKQLIWPSIPHGGVVLLTNQLEMISRGPPNCSITKSLLHVVYFGFLEISRDFHTAWRRNNSKPVATTLLEHSDFDTIMLEIIQSILMVMMSIDWTNFENHFWQSNTF